MNELETQSTTLERIQNYVEGRGSLSISEKRIYNRWLVAFALIRQRESKSAVVRYLRKIKQGDGEPLSESQAWRDIRNAERLFGNFRQYEKEVLRLLVIDEAIRDSKQAQKAADKLFESEDWRAWEAVMKIKHKAEERIINAGGLNKEDPMVPDFARIQPPDLEITLPDDQIEMIKKMLTVGYVDLSEILPTVDVAFVEVQDDEES